MWGIVIFGSIEFVYQRMVWLYFSLNQTNITSQLEVEMGQVL